ncbi:MAG: HNH endonuclease [Pyrinomonadaceae bacterium]
MKRIPKLTLTQIYRFWLYVDRTGGPESCWLWQGFIRPSGYGVVGFNRREFKVHRVSYFLEHGRISDDLLVLHHCDVRSCVNPQHLYQGTAKDNTHDAVMKGRHTRVFGEQNGNHKLTAGQVESIRRMCRERIMLQKRIASYFGVSEAAVSYIANGGRWKSD